MAEEVCGERSMKHAARPCVGYRQQKLRYGYSSHPHSLWPLSRPHLTSLPKISVNSSDEIEVFAVLSLIQVMAV